MNTLFENLSIFLRKNNRLKLVLKSRVAAIFNSEKDRAMPLSKASQFLFGWWKDFCLHGMDTSYRDNKNNCKEHIYPHNSACK